VLFRSMKATICVLVLAAFVCLAYGEEEEIFTIMLDSKDFLAHHPERGLLNHHEMEEHIPLLLQLDEQMVMDNLVPDHCEKPEVKFDEHSTGDAFIQIQSALIPTVPLNPAKPFDMSTLLPLAAGAYFLSNGGLSSITGALQQSGVGTNEMMQALPVLISLGSSLTGAGGNSQQGGGAGGMGALSQLMPMLAPMLSGGGGAGGGAGGGGMAQLMQMAPQLMQMAGGMGGGGGGMGGMGGGMGGMGGGMGGGNAAAMAQLLPMLMGGGGGAGGI